SRWRRERPRTAVRPNADVGIVLPSPLLRERRVPEMWHLAGVLARRGPRRASTPAKFDQPLCRLIQIVTITYAQRTSLRMRKITTASERANTSDAKNKGLASQQEMMHQGISESKKRASSVPTAFAFNEFHTSPWIRSEKLVVMPHDGQGYPPVIV